jgi:NTP pyrophosphatase (non-canonical NTP hydrolase)
MTDLEMIDCPEPGKQLARLRAIMHRLRAPGGCPWDAEQTHASLITNLIEEAYETVDTIQRGDHDHLKEELGDLLLQVIFHSELAEEAGRFNLEDVARGISDKLVRRHPHVFATSEATTPDAVLQQWDEIKRAEKGHEEHPYLHGVGKGLPALLRAAKLQKKASKVGFDWPDETGVLDKIREETRELALALDGGGTWRPPVLGSQPRTLPQARPRGPHEHCQHQIRVPVRRHGAGPPRLRPVPRRRHLGTNGSLVAGSQIHVRSEAEGKPGGIRPIVCRVSANSRIGPGLFSASHAPAGFKRLRVSNPRTRDQKPG